MNEPAKLPPAIRRAARKLREQQPPEGFEVRLSEALRVADEQTPRERPSRLGRWLPHLGRAHTLAAACAGVLAISALWVYGGTVEDGVHRVEEIQLSLEGDGHTWMPLTLDTEHHDGEHAHVRVEVPRDVRVEASHHARATSAPACGVSHCVHRFQHPTAPHAEPHFRIGVRSPGDYRIHVEHASPVRRVREVFVVAAR